MLTRDMAREVWSGTGARITDLSPADLSALRRDLDREMRASGLIRGSFRMEPRIRTRRNWGRLAFAELRCRSDYFEGRQAVTFEQSGFVGFGGWADDTNIQPILIAFAGWARDRVEARRAA